MGFWAADPPPPPDYAAAARDQGAANAETARLETQLNRPNEVNPYGTRTWSQNGDQYTVTDEMSPAERQKYEAKNALENAMLGIAGNQGLPLISDALNQNFTPPREAQIGWENDYAPDQRLQTESGMWELPYIQETLDYSGAPGLRSQYNESGIKAIPTSDAEMRKKMEDTLYSSGARYLDPQYNNQQSDLESKLSNQGIQPGSEAYTRAMQEFNDQKERAYASLRDSSISGGGVELERQHGLEMQEHNTGFSDETQRVGLANSARGQYTGEQMEQGQFANASRGQMVQELLGDMASRNNAIMSQANLATGQQNASNNGTAAWLEQKAASVNQPVNLMNSVMSGTQVNNPQFQNYNNNISWEAAPVYQAAKDGYQAAANASNAKNAQTGQFLQMGGTIGAAAL